ncbi:MAG: NAD(P)/FAD-dependent oxidoreductase [Fimbriimonadaceae bacterium]
MEFDVAIIGGGPGGSTVGSILRKYDPTMRVGIFEREVFPRDHVGESQLPGIGAVLAEMGVWEKIEAANFPIKLGATYRWGKSKELWDFQFIPKEQFVEEVRPARYVGQRTQTAFQVDRAIYDEILLKHSEELGCDVFQGVGVAMVNRDGDRVTGLELTDGRVVVAKHYIDASGHSGILRRAMGVNIDVATSLQNVAFWDYWQNAEWATEIGIGGTFVQVMSLGYGWIWFIPLGPTRTSVGLIVPADYYKKSGARPEELYRKALGEDDRIRHLMRDAVSEEKFETTKDWSFMADRHAGENWMLVGEAGGFADPILAAGMTITHISAREAANTILEARRGRLPAEWLREQYDIRQKRRIRNHIRFADFWYTSNGQFTDLQDLTAQIAKDSGLDLDPAKAWQWIAQGGFIDEDLSFGSGGYTLEALKRLPNFLNDYEVESVLVGKNRLELKIDDADIVTRAFYGAGSVERIEGFSRDGRILPLRWVIQPLINILRVEKSLGGVLEKLEAMRETMQVDEGRKNLFMSASLRGLEAMVTDGWVIASYDPSFSRVELNELYSGLEWSDDLTVGPAI